VNQQEYRLLDAVSKSDLDVINRFSPAHYKYKRDQLLAGEPETPTTAMTRGTAFHAAVLEPDEFLREYVVLPGRPINADGRAKKDTPERRAYDIWKESVDSVQGELAGRTIISFDEMDTLVMMRRAVMGHPTASALLARDHCEFEYTLQWTHEALGFPCKARPDAINKQYNVVIDLKSTQSGNWWDLMHSIRRYRYNVQHVWYMEGMFACGFRPQGFVFIFVETSPPYGVRCITLPPSALTDARAQLTRDVSVIAHCRATNTWDSYPTDIQEISWTTR
jgi:hypothetical protein